MLLLTHSDENDVSKKHTFCFADHVGPKSLFFQQNFSCAMVKFSSYLETVDFDFRGIIEEFL